MTHQDKKHPAQAANPTPTKDIKTASLVFDLPLYTRQISDFRQVICSVVNANRELFTEKEAILFHNHTPDTEDGRRHSPALIQYRVEKSMKSGHRPSHNAWLFGINEGAVALQKFMAIQNKKIYIGNRDINLEIKDFNYKTQSLHYSQTPIMYKTKKWIALSPRVYKEYFLPAKNMYERLDILNERLNLHLRNLSDALDWNLPEDIKAEIQHIRHMDNVKCWNKKMIAFDIDYSVPLIMPKAMAIGRAVSHGFGVQYPLGRI